MKHLLLTLIAFFSIFSVDGLMQDYLKPALEKGDDHYIRNVDFIYLINLDQRPEKWAHCLNELEPYGIRPYRFSAVNGWELPLETFGDVGVAYIPGKSSCFMATCYLPELGGCPHHEIMSVPGRHYFCHCMSRGAVAIVLSHVSVLQDAYNSVYETVWVMEDDIEVNKDPHIISDLIEKLDAQVGRDHWDVLFTDRDTKNNHGVNVICLSYAHRPNFRPKNPSKFSSRVNVGPDFRSIGARYGSYSMIVNRSGMKKLLDFFKQYQIFLPYDMDFCLPDDMNFFTLREDVVSTTPGSLSDNGSANYLKKNRGSLTLDSDPNKH